MYTVDGHGSNNGHLGQGCVFRPYRPQQHHKNTPSKLRQTWVLLFFLLLVGGLRATVGLVVASSKPEKSGHRMGSKTNNQQRRTYNL